MGMRHAVFLFMVTITLIGGTTQTLADPPAPGDLEVLDLWMIDGGAEVILRAEIINVSDSHITDDFYCSFIYYDVADGWICVNDGTGVLVTNDIPIGGQITVEDIDADYSQTQYCQVGLMVPYEPGTSCNVFDPPEFARRENNVYWEDVCVAGFDLAPGVPWQFSPPLQLAGRTVAVNMTNLGPGQFSLPFYIDWYKYQDDAWVSYVQQHIDHDFFIGQLE